MPSAAKMGLAKGTLETLWNIWNIPTTSRPSGLQWQQGRLSHHRLPRRPKIWPTNFLVWNPGISQKRVASYVTSPYLSVLNMVNPTINYPEYHQECMINLPELEVIIGLTTLGQIWSKNSPGNCQGEVERDIKVRVGGWRNGWRSRWKATKKKDLSIAFRML